MGIYGINHEMMAGGNAPDDAFREYGTDYYEEREMWDDIVRNEKPLVKCDWCEKEVRTVYPVYFNEADPTHSEDSWCRECINKAAGPVFEDDLPF